MVTRNLTGKINKRMSKKTKIKEISKCRMKNYKLINNNWKMKNIKLQKKQEKHKVNDWNQCC